MRALKTCVKGWCGSRANSELPIPSVTHDDQVRFEGRTGAAGLRTLDQLAGIVDGVGNDLRRRQYFWRPRPEVLKAVSVGAKASSFRAPMTARCSITLTRSDGASPPAPTPCSSRFAGYSRSCKSVWRMTLAVNRTILSKGMKCERKRHVERNVDDYAISCFLYNHPAYVPSCRNGTGIKCRSLPRLPGKNQVISADFPYAPQQCDRPRFIAPGSGLDRYDSLHWVDTLRHRSIIQERSFSDSIVCGIWISSIIARACVRRDKHLPGGESLTKPSERFHSGGQQPKTAASQGTDNGFASELLPPTLGLAIVHHQPWVVGKQTNAIIAII